METGLTTMAFGDIQILAKSVADSKLFSGIDTQSKALVLMMICQGEGINPAQAMQRYDIIQGKPAKKSQAILSDFLKSGGKIEWVEYSDKRCAAKFSHPIFSPTPILVDWDIPRADKAGLVAKNGGMYHKYPRQMLSSRVISEGVRRVNPDSTGGLYTPEEVMDIEPTKEHSAETEVISQPKPLTQIIGPTQPEIVNPEPVREAQPQEVKVEPTKETSAVAQTTNDRIKAVKLALGEEDFKTILGKNGFTSFKEVKSLKKAEAILKVMEKMAGISKDIDETMGGK